MKGWGSGRVIAVKRGLLVVLVVLAVAPTAQAANRCAGPLELGPELTGFPNGCTKVFHATTTTQKWVGGPDWRHEFHFAFFEGEERTHRGFFWTTKLRDGVFRRVGSGWHIRFTLTGDRMRMKYRAETPRAFRLDWQLVR
jgi:hypothetical protein